MPSRDGQGLIEARGLHRSFGRAHVLRGLDLSLNSGEALAVIGPNGAGKTTLLRVLAGLMRPTAGEIKIVGHPARSEPARCAVGLLSHQSLLYDDLTLLENLSFTARLYSISSPREAALGALEAMGLTRQAGELPRRLSRGLLQRAAIARSVLHSPRVLLLDEPFTALDAGAAERLRSDLLGRLSQGLGLILVTHQLSEVWDLASRVAVLVEGRWAAYEAREGSLETFLPRYHELIGA